MIEFDSSDAISLCKYTEVGTSKQLNINGISDLDTDTDIFVNKVCSFISETNDSRPEFRSGLFKGMGLGVNTYHYIDKLYVKKINFEDIHTFQKGIIFTKNNNTIFYINSDSLEIFNKLSIRTDIDKKYIFIRNPETTLLDTLKISLNIQNIAN
jgi:hypothetical protein